MLIKNKLKQICKKECIFLKPRDIQLFIKYTLEMKSSYLLISSSLAGWIKAVTGPQMAPRLKVESVLVCVAGCAAVCQPQSDWPESSVLLNVEKLQRRRQKRRCLRLSSQPFDTFHVLWPCHLLSHFFFSSSLSDLGCWVPAPATASWVLKTVIRRRRPLRWTPESSSDTSRPRASRPGSCSH